MLYNWGINDSSIHITSHRSVYDIYKLDCKNSLTIENINEDIFIKHFFLTIDKFKIFNIQIATSFMVRVLILDELFRVIRLLFIKKRLFELF